MHTRTVFFVSDGTGITAETFGNAILAQFEFKPRHVRLPFIDTVDKAHQVVRQVNHTAEVEGRRPVVFTTLVNVEVLQVIEEGCKAMVLDMFGTFVRPLEIELGMKSSHRVGRFTDVSAGSGIRNAGWGMGCAIADYDNDGLLDGDRVLAAFRELRPHVGDRLVVALDETPDGVPEAIVALNSHFTSILRGEPLPLIRDGGSERVHYIAPRPVRMIDDRHRRRSLLRRANEPLERRVLRRRASVHRRPAEPRPRPGQSWFWIG